MSYNQTPEGRAARSAPWTCPDCKITIKHGGKGPHSLRCGHKRIELFWSHVNKTETCWLYEGTISFEGYGYVNVGSYERRKQWQAHRYAWTLLRGPIPADACLLHHCDVRNCVNPDHLYLGDRQDNTNDKMARGRYRHRYSPVETLFWPELSKRVKP